MARKEGDRVGAIMGANQDAMTVEFFGFGTYVGDRVPEVPADSRGMAAELMEVDFENPCIELDNGERVYGCECWWGAEDAIQRKLDAWKEHGWAIREVLPSEARRPLQACQFFSSPRTPCKSCGSDPDVDCICKG